MSHNVDPVKDETRSNPTHRHPVLQCTHAIGAVGQVSDAL